MESMKCVEVKLKTANLNPWEYEMYIKSGYRLSEDGSELRRMYHSWDDEEPCKCV